ncbi:MAG TPA: TIM barrel protein [Actinoplanes sp.]|nr:TIM barrel protein [Actinoplanes sp.]
MRLKHHSGRVVHLSAGLDIRPARDLPAVVDQLDTYAAAMRRRLRAGILGVSLWLPPILAAALATDGRARTRLRAELDARGLEVVTLSGVPYAGGGGEDSSGDQRYVPDWSDPARLEYTLDLARILVDLLPEDAVRGAVTTIGLGRRVGWDTGKERACTRIMRRLSAGLAEVAWHTGRAVRVGFQPEPGCVLDATDQTVAALARTDRDRIGVCLDLAGLACTWEDPARTLDRLAEAGISVIRVQAGAAVEVSEPVAAAERLRSCARTGCQQVTNPAGAYLDDVAGALAEMPPGPWRVRHHLPLNVALDPPLSATTDVWRSALRHLMAGALPGTEYVDVHPAGPVADDVAYVKKELESLGLSPPTQARAA